MSSFAEASTVNEALNSDKTPGDWSTHKFVIPSRNLMDQRDMGKWKESSSCAEVFGFIKACTESVVGKKCSDVLATGESPSMAVTKFVSFMQLMQQKVDEFPPIKQPMRFGNKAFKQWQLALIDECPAFLRDLLPEELHGAIPELIPYISTSFGNEIRIDYGTGHESTIMVFFLCLYKLRVITLADCAQVVLLGFGEYLKTMRILQISYLLEPAGSHGAWGLDDYHCLIFLFGAAQLCSQKSSEEGMSSTGEVVTSSIEVITPQMVHDQSTLDEGSGEYMYLEGIKFIKFLKTGAPFAETSPMLNDISGLADWNKICTGLLRLYQAEVLHKFPVVQHLLFGSILMPPIDHTPVAAASAAGVAVLPDV